MDTGKKYRFIIVGSGWRALYYVRIAKALPQLFELGAMLCRTEEKAEKIHRENDIYATTSIAECIGMKPDFVVVAVSKASIADVSCEWLRRGFPVLCETPVVQTKEQAEAIRELTDRGGKLAVAEQYTRFPSVSAVLKILEKGLIGEPDYAVVSMAHEYHGASLIRAFLQLDDDIEFAVSGREYTFATIETLSRYEKFTDGRVVPRRRTVAVYEFANAKAALYEFDYEQYRSPIRGNMLKIQGVRGEILGDTVRFLDEKNEAQVRKIVAESREVRRESDNPNLRLVREITQILFDGEVLYVPPFGLCGLMEDETAMAEVLRDMGEYVRGYGENPYPFEKAFRDVMMVWRP